MDEQNNMPELPPRHRQFIYRAAEQDSSVAHPLRRATDHPRPFRTVAGHRTSGAVLLRFRVCLKVN